MDRKLERFQAVVSLETGDAQWIEGSAQWIEGSTQCVLVMPSTFEKVTLKIQKSVKFIVSEGHPLQSVSKFMDTGLENTFKIK